MTAAFSKGRSKTYEYYCCQNKGCTAARKNYPIQGVNVEFREFLGSLSIKPEFMAKLEERIIQKAEEERGAHKAVQARKEAELRALNDKMQQLIDMRERTPER